jgi:hypothetical protein
MARKKAHKKQEFSLLDLLLGQTKKGKTHRHHHHHGRKKTAKKATSGRK